MSSEPISPKDTQQLRVYKKGIFAGTLSRIGHGSEFVYDREYLESSLGERDDRFQIALAYPLRSEPFVTRGDNLPPFFAGLLPEGIRLQALVKSAKTSADDMFTLLAASGSDLIGDTAIAHEELFKRESSAPIANFDDADFYRLFEESIASPLRSDRERDPSIAGIQPKVSAQLLSFPVKVADRKKRYILKLGSKDYPHIIANEDFFMKLAYECGISTAKTKIVHDKNGKAALLVERFDRLFDASRKTFLPLHVEDACQLLKTYPSQKYLISLRDVASALTKHCRYPIIEVSLLIKQIAFSYLIANGDLHGKNISIREDHKTGGLHLAPAYDVLTTLPYGDNSMALKLEGKDKNLAKRSFVEFGKAFGVREKVVGSLLEELKERVTEKLEDIKQLGFDSKKSQFLVKTICERRDSL